MISVAIIKQKCAEKVNLLQIFIVYQTGIQLGCDIESCDALMMALCTDDGRQCCDNVSIIIGVNGFNTIIIYYWHLFEK